MVCIIYMLPCFLPPAASCASFMAKTLNKNYTSHVCHLPLHLCCSHHSPYEDFMPQATPGLQPMPLLQATRNDVKWRAGNPKLSMLLVNHLQKLQSALLISWNNCHGWERHKPSKSRVLRQGHSCCSHSDTTPSPQALRQRHQDCRRENQP